MNEKKELILKTLEEINLNFNNPLAEHYRKEFLEDNKLPTYNVWITVLFSEEIDLDWEKFDQYFPDNVPNGCNGTENWKLAAKKNPKNCGENNLIVSFGSSTKFEKRALYFLNKKEIGLLLKTNHLNTDSVDLTRICEYLKFMSDFATSYNNEKELIFELKFQKLIYNLDGQDPIEGITTNLITLQGKFQNSNDIEKLLTNKMGLLLKNKKDLKEIQNTCFNALTYENIYASRF